MSTFPGANPQQPLNIARWNEIKNNKTPFNVADKKEFGFWFNYFWSEAIALKELNDLQKKTLVAVFDSVLAGAGPNFTETDTYKKSDDNFKFKALEHLLLIGFKRWEIKVPKIVDTAMRAIQMAPPALRTSMAQDLNLTTFNFNKQVIPIAFRSDLRDWETLQSHNGFRTRARSEKSPVHAAHGLDKKWHPYNHPTYRNSLFLRMGQTNMDNCLHTAISVGQNFWKITHFPILGDGTVFTERDAADRPLAAKPFDLWTALDKAAVEASTASQQVKAKPEGGPIEYLEKTNHIYCFHLMGITGVNTQEEVGGAKSEAFPERGVAKVPLQNFLAEITYIQRWWYNGAQGLLKMFEVDFSPIRWLPDYGTVEALLGANAMQSLVAQIHNEQELAKQRKEFTDDKMYFETYKLRAATKLRFGDEELVVKELAAYLKGTTKADSRAEKAEMKVKFPQIASRIDALSPPEWSQLRTEANKSNGPAAPKAPSKPTGFGPLPHPPPGGSV